MARRRTLLDPPAKRPARAPEKPVEARPSQFSTACCLCGGKVAVGDLIERANRRTEHQACAEQARQALAVLGGAAPVVFYREEAPELGKPLRLRPGDGDEGTEGQVVVPLVHRRRFFRGDGLLFGLKRPLGWLYTVQARPASAEEIEQLNRPPPRLSPDDRRALWRAIEQRILDEGKPSESPRGRQWPPAARRQPHHSYLVLTPQSVSIVRPSAGSPPVRLRLDARMRADLRSLGALAPES